MIGNDKKVRICDFGMSTKLKTSDQTIHQETGTIHYQAPEVFKRNYTQKCDIWSIGCVLYQMVTGVMPFDGEKGIGYMIKAIKQGNYKPMPEGTSTDIQDLIKNMLKVDVKQRFSAE